MSAPTAAQALDFLDVVAKLKTTLRTGWVENGVRNVESVADHMYRMAILSLLCKDEALDVSRLIKVSIMHDVAEAVIGDLSPKQMRERGISKEAKYEMERQAMKDISEIFKGSPLAEELLALWDEYENGDTKECFWVKDIDRLEMGLQAFDYERAQGVDLSPFYGSVKGRIEHPWLKSLCDELMARREEYLKTHTLEKRSEATRVNSLLIPCLATFAAGLFIGFAFKTRRQ
eukprot:TRINITY_DN9103_c0_g2_i1.p1 TRINITY_DN9103_c0_g2~~TRINITY_DN9103_c0_g2_i1.p1  ORF type:complete len:231 (+),score=74.06 TRINITY_DN9103_c0_g2_i1:136-828(+)